MEVNDSSKSDVSQINILATSKAEPVNSGSKKSTRVLCKKKARTGVLPSPKQQGNNIPKYHGAQSY